MEFIITPAAGVPIYQQLTGQICSAIARGRLAPDERLPSVRELSQALVVNPNTVARAYTELERDGTLYTRPGMGVFVSKSPAPLAKAERRERLIPDLDTLLVSAVRFGCSIAELVELVEQRAEQFRWHRAAEGTPTTN
jgi:GntR family transcriptional regulator